MLTVCVVCGKAQQGILEYSGHRYHRCIECGFVSTYPATDRAALTRHCREASRRKLLPFYRGEILVTARKA